MAGKRQYRYIARVGREGPARETALVCTLSEARRFIRKVCNVGKPWALFLFDPDRRIAAGFVRRDRTTDKPIMACL